MKNKIIALLTGAFAMTVLVSSRPEGDVPLSSGAPIGSTNAPGELTCGKAGCHTGDDNINTGSGVLSISSQQDISKYIPGATYDITVSLEQSGIDRFGYSVTVLDENSNKAGTLTVTDAARTQIFQGAQQFTGRDYMTYRMIGTNPYSKNKGQWSFKWTAPATNVGKITFYAAGIAANNDATHYGDQVYTTTMSAMSVPAGVDNIHGASASFTVYPNPVKDYMLVQFANKMSGTFQYNLYNTEGKLVKEYTQPAGNNIPLPVNGLPAGTYYLKIQGAGFSATEKVLLIN